MAGAERGSWLGRLERRLKTVFGPAAVSDPGRPRGRSADRMEGVGGAWELHRSSDGRTYLVAHPPAEEPGQRPPTDQPR